MADGSSALDGTDALTLGIARSRVASILGAFDATNPSGLINNDSAQRGVANLISAIKTGNPSNFSFSPGDLAALAPRGSDSALSQPGSSGSGSDIFSTLTSAISTSLDLGNIATALTLGQILAKEP